MRARACAAALRRIAAMMLAPLRTLLRRRRPLIPFAAPTFFTSSGSIPPEPPLPSPPAAPAVSPDESEQEGSLARRVEPAASVCAAIRGWMAAQPRRSPRPHIPRRKPTSPPPPPPHHLPGMEWVMRERPYKLSELDYFIS